MTRGLSEPDYRRVASALRTRIRSGEFEPGAQLPSLPQLMDQYDATIAVVREAIKALRAEQLVTTTAGKGSFVCDVLPEPSEEYREVMQRLDAFQAELHTLADQVRELRERTGLEPRQVAPQGDQPRRSGRRAAP